jgi:hypothetical protein
LQYFIQEIEFILNGSKKGAVLISFGSIADTRKMPQKMLEGMIKAFLRFPEFEFIWKLDRESTQNQTALFSLAQNVHCFEWVEQAELLRKGKFKNSAGIC